MPIKHHFGKSEWLKINQQRPQLVPHVYREAYISYINCNRGKVCLRPGTQQRKYDYFALLASELP